MIRRTLEFTGRVQGVGFRATTASIARRYAVAGYVRNLDDGRVRLVAEAAPAEMGAFLDEVRQAMASNIEREEVHDTTPTGEFNRFRTL